MTPPDIESALITRLQAEVPALRRVEDALSFSRLVEARRLPPDLPAAFVLWEGDSASPPVTGSGPWLQSVTERVAIVLVDYHRGDSRGSATKNGLRALRDSVRAVLTGWAGPEFTPLAYVRGRLDAVGDAGAVAATLTFSTTWTLRI